MKNILPFKNKYPKVDESVYVDPLARVIGDVVIGPDSVVSFGAIVRGDDEHIEIGRRVVILENVIIEAPKDRPVYIGDNVLVSHGAIIHGAVVEEEVLIGIGAIVLDNSIVGRGSIIGAGAVVPPKSRIPPRSLVLGIPAKVVRQVKEGEIDYVKNELEKVLLKAKEYRRILFKED